MEKEHGGGWWRGSGNVHNLNDEERDAVATGFGKTKYGELEVDHDPSTTAGTTTTIKRGRG